MADTLSDISTLIQGLRRASGGNLILQRKIASSGEGSIYLTDDPLSLAKVYHAPGFEKAQKLQHMLENPPTDPTASQGHISIAWPKDLILDKQGTVHGFLMPKIRGGVTLPLVYNPRLRRKKYPAFNWYYLHTTALNLAWIIEALHAKGYIVGDLKPENFLVNDRALVSILDTDSFQIPGKDDGDSFLCPVGSEGFTPPELFGKDLTKEPRLPSHDHFGLAVLIYQLLFGIHPFASVWKGEEDPPSLKDCIQKGLVPFSANRVASQFIERSPLIPSLKSLHKTLQEMFVEAFVEGHWDPSKRPPAQKWHRVLEKSLEELQVCSDSTNHFLYPSQGECPWCHLSDIVGVDIFPMPAHGEKLSAFTVLKLFEKALSEGNLENAQAQLKFLEEMPEAQTAVFQKAFLLFSKIKDEQEIIASFAKFLESHPDEADILAYFKKYSLLEKSSVYALRSPLLQGKSLQEIKEHAATQTEILKKLEALQEKASHKEVPLSFLFEDLLTLLPAEDIQDSSIFSTLVKYIKEAKYFFERYSLLNRYNLEGKEEGLFLWHPCFEYPLQRDGLWIPFLDLIRAHAGSLSSSSRFSFDKTKIFEEEQGAWVRLHPISSRMQTSPVYSLLKEGCMVFMHLEDTSTFFFPIPPQMLQTGQVDFFIDTSFIPSYNVSFSVASLWYFEETPLTQGPAISIEKEKTLIPLRMKISKPSLIRALIHKGLHAFFPSYFTDKARVTIVMQAKEEVDHPPFILKAARGRISLDLDLSTQAKIIGHISASTLKKEVIHIKKLEISLKAFLRRALKKEIWSIEHDPSFSTAEAPPFYFVSL